MAPSQGPKAPFYIAVFVVIIGLVAFAGWRFFGGSGEPDGPVDDIDPNELAGTSTQVEDPNSDLITTVTEYENVSAERLIPVTGTSEYQPMVDNTVRFALNVWAGWAPIIYANEGAKPGKIWKTPDGKEFKIQLVLKDDPAKMLDSYVAGSEHIGWGTLDMLPLFMQRLVDDNGKPLDSRVMPRVFQQIDWSAGGDGIVVREEIKEVSDLRGKTIALAQNSPSHFFVLNMLVNAGVQPREVTFQYFGDAFQAAAAFASDKKIDACVSWAPDIYTISEAKGNSLLVTSADANRLIADVWFARADFAKDHPDIIEGIVRGIFDAMDEMESQDAQAECAKHMAELYAMTPEDAQGMLADAYSTRWGDNYQFFVNKNYLANFERVWNNSYYLYRKIRVITKPKIEFDQVMDNSIIKKLGEEDKYKNQLPQKTSFTARTITQAEADEAFLTATHYILFYPNSADMRKEVEDESGKTVKYDPNVDFVLDRIGGQIGQFERSRIVIEGHTDSSMQGQGISEELVKTLSQDRANAVKEELLKKFDQLDPNRFEAIGRGWDRPADPERPNEHAKNRRVEVKILPLESE